MDNLVRRIENATQQRNDAFRVANQDDTILLPNLEGREECPTCCQPINGRRPGAMDWVGLPAGVRFDPSDEELLQHLTAKLGRGSGVSHPLIDDFISPLIGDDGICQTHPENLPGVKTDGSSRHFFHKPAKAYTTGTRKRRKIHKEDEESGVETRWHKTGKTRPVTDGGQLLGWKKIMVLYRNSYSGKKKAKSEKTNWILHQYHLGPDEEERDGELVVCKVFYQKQPRQCTGGRQAEAAIVDGDGSKPETSQVHPQMDREISVACVSDASRGTLITPKRDAPHRPQFSRHRSREVSPSLQAHVEPTAIRTPTQSGRGSDMTVIGKSDHPTSEMTSSLGGPIRHAQNVTTCLNTGSFQSGGLIHSVQLEALRENGSPDGNEEVSTSGKSYQNENALIAAEDLSRDDEYDAQPYLACQSQLPETDQDLPELSDLHCTEELTETPFFYDLGMQSFEHDGTFDEGHAFGDIFNPNPEYPYFEEILLSTPPAILSDMKLSSQEVEMWNLRHCEHDPNDNSDSLSST